MGSQEWVCKLDSYVNNQILGTPSPTSNSRTFTHKDDGKLAAAISD